ncbi:hypothetical protein AKJ09_09291 [Labilithrix luteola]|uniref:Uncharacterized protein n=1 Tax=Labilithrix luteola TaxID=1391654 RepID=A0A0K1QA68_9BACT|nr:hypothetical protein [Labilithrix luteola]AKV02628.1 hypothetical protein AKJ09_09291 [Labilithrix luteola]
MRTSSTLHQTPSTGFSSYLRSVGAVLAGLFAGAALSLATDEILHLLQVYPPWGEPMTAPGLNLLALAYRCVFDAAGLYLVARLAPRTPIRHLWIAAGIGFVVAMLGVLASLNANLGPVWYPVVLALSTFPCAWAAAVLYAKRVPTTEPVRG